MRVLASVTLTLLLAAGCDGPGELTWRVRFAEPSLSAATSVVRVRMRRGDCEGEILYEAQLGPEDTDAMRPPTPSGGDTVAFEAIAVDASCREVARVCRVLPWPPDQAEVELVLEGPGSGADTCPDATCTDGVCAACEGCALDAGIDGGGRDAGLDGGGLDAGTDAAMPDAGFPAPRVVSPWNGVSTGSPRRTAGSLTDDPLAPEIRWESVAGAGSYVVELVACTDVPSACDFISATRVVVAGTVERARPEAPLDVDATAPVGRRYAFRVGACPSTDGTACSFAPARYLDVGRVREDLDGDGDGDLVLVGERSDGDRELLRQDSPSATRPVTTSYVRPSIGAAAWAGDYDADGVGELVVATDGAVGGRWALLEAFAEVGSDGSDATGARLGASLAGAGDVDGDGYADFLVGAPGAGEVRVQLGGPTFDASRRVTIPAPSGVTLFGMDVSTAGDRDGDGLADVAVIGRISLDFVRVLVYSLAGRAHRLIQMEDIWTYETGASSTTPISMRGGLDMDDDGRPEIVVGRWVGGFLTVMFAGRVEATDQFADMDFGRSVAMGDLDGTGRGRAVVGAPLFTMAPWGSVGATFHLNYTDRLAATRIAYSNAERFGEVVSVTDMDGDGREDMASLGRAGGVFHLGLFNGVTVGGTARFGFTPSGIVRFHGLSR